jgi:hypothetical protein
MSILRAYKYMGLSVLMSEEFLCAFWLATRRVTPEDLV